MSVSSTAGSLAPNTVLSDYEALNNLFCSISICSIPSEKCRLHILSYDLCQTYSAFLTVNSIDDLIFTELQRSHINSHVTELQCELSY